jgi:hypothetical protein
VLGFTGLPLAVAAVPMALVGAGRPAARMQLGVAAKYGGAKADADAAGPRFTGVIAHSFVVLVPALVAFVAALYFVYVIGAGYLYPLRPDAIAAIGHPFSVDPRFKDSWGPSVLVGTWLAHSAVAAATQPLAVVLIRAMTVLQGRSARRFLMGR